MSNPAEAFLSYTRLDDEYFSGAITKLRERLELGVKVVTGDRSFSIFQDIEGIEFGVKWRKRLNEAISTSRFLIPVVTPLFFKSEACRDELKQFIDHEKSLGRDDLILPIYFVTAPVLERPELLKNDPLAAEIRSRQLYRWLDQADLPPTDPSIRPEITKLARKIAESIERVSGTSSLGLTQPNESVAHEHSPPSDRSPGPAKEKTRTRRQVLWVDDKPRNNVIERRSMAAYSIDFVLAQSTDEALTEIKQHQFDAIISDMDRPPDPQAGYTLLEALRGCGDQTPFFIYCGLKSPDRVRGAEIRGAQGITNVGDELIQMLLSALEV